LQTFFSRVQHARRDITPRERTTAASLAGGNHLTMFAAIDQSGPRCEWTKEKRGTTASVAVYQSN